MRARRSAPKLRSRLTLLTTLLSITALIILGAALIYSQARNYAASTRADIEYALKSTNAAMRANMTQISRVIRDLRNAPSFAPLWAGEPNGAQAAREGLEYSADLYSDVNLISGAHPFLREVAVFREGRVISCSYYPSTQAERALADARMRTLNDEFIVSGEESAIIPDGEQLVLLTRLYSLDMHDLGVALFAISKSAIEANYEALTKYEGASYALTGKDGAALAGAAANGREYLKHSQALPFGILATARVPEEQIGRLVRPALFSMAVVILLLVPVIALIAFIIAYYVSKPLKVVADRIGRVEAGDYTAKLHLPEFYEFQNIGARFNAMTDTIRHLVTEVYEKQLLAKESEIKFLQSQMNPHFMYNVLTMIAMTAKRNGDEEAYKLLHSFASLSRGRVFTGSQLMIPLKQELELVNYYLFLQCKRYEDRITYSIRVDDALNSIPVPRLCIEPIAENAFLHGMEPKGAGRVEIRAELNGDTLVVTVTDDGVGFKTDERAEGVGIANTRKILQNVFGPQYGVSVVSAPGEGTVATVTMPAKGGR